MHVLLVLQEKQNAARDWQFGINTTCDETLCAMNQKVQGNTCVSCPGGKTNAGDDASSSNTTCDEIWTNVTECECAETWTSTRSMTGWPLLAGQHGCRTFENSSGVESETGYCGIVQYPCISSQDFYVGFPPHGEMVCNPDTPVHEVHLPFPNDILYDISPVDPGASFWITWDMKINSISLDTVHYSSIISVNDGCDGSGIVLFHGYEWGVSSNPCYEINTWNTYTMYIGSTGINVECQGIIFHTSHYDTTTNLL